MYDAGETHTQTAQRELGQAIPNLAFNVVETSGLLEELNDASKFISAQLEALSSGSERVGASVTEMAGQLEEIDATSTASLERTKETITDLQDSGAKAREVAEFVNSLHDRIKPLEDSLKQVRDSTQKIAGIATEVNILAINARIEAARAGEEGRGFAVVAESIGQLSKQTEDVTKTISDEVQKFGSSMRLIKDEAQNMSEKATIAIDATDRSDAALAEISGQMIDSTTQIHEITNQAKIAGEENARFSPVLTDVISRVTGNAAAIETGHEQTKFAAEAVERVVQLTVESGIPTDDTEMIERVTDAAKTIGGLFDDAVSSGRITLDGLFDTRYTSVPGSDPEQVTTRFTDLTDQLLPDIQEVMLESDPRVVFCAAVDRNGYLPTHNKKFSQPQGDDPVWNAANSRNRRIFDDPVGLKSGRNTSQFLLQVYRRDMGGGHIVMMKDLSAPIMVQGRHWGGLRLAYKPS